MIIRLHTLRQILKSMGLYRRQNESSPLEVESFIIDQQEGYERFHGNMLDHLNCIQAGYVDKFTL